MPRRTEPDKGGSEREWLERSTSLLCSTKSFSITRFTATRESIHLLVIHRVSSSASTAMDLQVGRLTRRLPFRPCCSRDDSRPPENNGKNDKGDKMSTDWDKAWSSFRKRGKKSLFSQFTPEKYVSWNPRRSEYPLSEELDPIKRTERSNLMLWTSPKFTLVGAIIVVSMLLIYTLGAPLK